MQNKNYIKISVLPKINFLITVHVLKFQEKNDIVLKS